MAAMVEMEQKVEVKVGKRERRMCLFLLAVGNASCCGA